MLADPRSGALVDNFAAQWLYLRNLPEVNPDAWLFPDFDDNLRRSMRRETELFFDSIVREDRSVMELLEADYTFVDERLARHYGLPHVRGSRFRRVDLGADSGRGGLLGHASILTVTSYATRTSPVLRGKWVLENILGTPPPPPPANVPPLADTRLPSLELALDSNFLVGNCDDGYNCVYVNTISWSSPTTPLPTETNPRRVFERLFGEGGSEAEMRAEVLADRSILDAMLEDLARLRATLGAGDRTRVSQYLDSVREVERRIRIAEPQANQPGLALPERPVGVPESYDEHARLMLDLQVLAYQADITRVFSLMLGREQTARTFPWIGVSDGHHAVSHHQDNPEKIAAIARINAYQVGLFAYLLQRLAATPDGEGSLLDHSMLLYGSGISNGNLHDHKNLPILVAGGGAGRLGGGRHISYREQTPMANLLLGLLDRTGVHLDRFGDSTGRIDLEPLSL